MATTPPRTQGDIPATAQPKAGADAKKKDMALVPQLSMANFVPDQRLVEAALGNNMEVPQSVVRRGGQLG